MIKVNEPFWYGFEARNKSPKSKEDLFCAQEMSQQSSFIESKLGKSHDGFPPLCKAQVNCHPIFFLMVLSGFSGTLFLRKSKAALSLLV